MITAGRNERGLLAVALGQLQAEHAAVEREGAIEVGDLEVNVADADFGMNGRRGRHSPLKLHLFLWARNEKGEVCAVWNGLDRRNRSHYVSGMFAGSQAAVQRSMEKQISKVSAAAPAKAGIK
jgi:hypothetical protein